MSVVTIFSLIVVFVLVIAEFSAYMTISVENDLVVDGKREEQMEIYVNITFPALPCACSYPRDPEVIDLNSHNTRFEY